jgi:hypothetical protein
MTEQKSGWSINPQNYSAATLAELHSLLNESPNVSQLRAIQKELVARTEKEQGLTRKEILKVLVAGVGTKRERREIAKEWCEALGMTEAEAKRLAD